MIETALATRPLAPDWSAVTAEELIAYRDAENRFRASEAARAVLGDPDPGATIHWQQVALSDRTIPVRVYRPASEPDSAASRTALPLVLHVHGGGFVGTAVQCDWANSHLATRLPALVVSVEHRLLAPDTPLAAAVDDAWDVLQHLTENAEEWGIDPTRMAVFGESCGALISALVAIRARDTGLSLRAQVLVNPAVDVTGSMFDYPSMAEYADTPTASEPQLRLFHRFAVPHGTNARVLSPLHADDLSALAPALVVVPTHDPLADHGRHYADRLWTAGTTTRLTEYPEAPHAFLTLPGLVEQAQAARAEILQALQDALTA